MHSSVANFFSGDEIFKNLESIPINLKVIIVIIVMIYH